LPDDTPNPARPPYPYLWGITNLIFIGLALGAVLDPMPQDITPKITGSAALIGAGAMLWRHTTKAHNAKQRAFTGGCLVIDALLVILIWTVR
jgi:hypothetical protein